MEINEIQIYARKCTNVRTARRKFRHGLYTVQLYPRRVGNDSAQPPISRMSRVLIRRVSFARWIIPRISAIRRINES